MSLAYIVRNSLCHITVFIGLAPMDFEGLLIFFWAGAELKASGQRDVVVAVFANCKPKPTFVQL